MFFFIFIYLLCKHWFQLHSRKPVGEKFDTINSTSVFFLMVGKEEWCLMRGGLSDIKEQHHLYFVAVTLTVIVVVFPLLSGIKVLHAQNGYGYFNVVL